MTKIIDTLALSGFWAGVKTRLNNKADASHSHVIADVASLQTALDGKANSAHTHTIANVTGLQTALDGKSDTGHTHSLATTTTAGHMSGADKVKLDGVAPSANNYTHPATHPPSIIATDSSNRFVSDAEKSTWNSKASTAVATSTTDGLYPKEHFAAVVEIQNTAYWKKLYNPQSGILIHTDMESPQRLIVEVVFNSFTVSTPMTYRLQIYPSPYANPGEWTFIQPRAWAISGSLPLTFTCFVINGKFLMWVPVQGVYQTVFARVLSAGVDGAGGVAHNKVTQITDAAKPSEYDLMLDVETTEPRPKATATADGLYPKEHWRKVDAIPLSPKYTDTITSINGKTGAITKADIVALGIPAQDTVVDISGKADKTYVDSQDDLKADKTYVDNHDAALTAQLADISTDVNTIKLNGVTVAPPEFANSVEDCTNTDKVYVLPDGYLYAYMEITSIVSDYTNLVPIATSSQGGSEIYNGTGYTNGKYVSSNNAYGNSADSVATGFIPCVVNGTKAPTIYIKGVSLDYSLSTRCRLYFNKNDGTTWEVNMISDARYYTITEIDTNYYCLEPIMDGLTPSIYKTAGGLSAFRVSGVGEGENLIVTIGEPIVVDEEITILQWTNTGHAYQPTDYEDRVIGLENKTAMLQTIVNGLSLGEKETLTYIAEESRRVASIVQEKRTIKSLTFTAMSDPHVAVGTEHAWLKPNLTSVRDAGLALTELQKHISLDFVVMLGDYTYGSSSWTISQIKEDIQYFKNHMRNGSIGVPNLWLTGNHDINYGADSERRMTEDEMYAYVTGNNVGTVQDSEQIGRNYGYIDFDNQKIRCIYLNSVDIFDYPDLQGVADDALEITAIQTQWLADKGLDLSAKTEANDWEVVIFTHQPLNLYSHVMKVLEAHRDRAIGSVDVTTNNITSTVNYDFTTGKGEVIANIHGHNHNFTHVKISSSKSVTPWLWRICIPNMDVTRENEAATSIDTGWAQKFGEFDGEGNPVYYKKTQGTSKSTSFCVVTIDKANRKIHAICYGAGYDREIIY